MFIPSNRLRRVDTPDVPTPGVVPPVIPPVAPAGYTAPAAAPAAGPAAPAAPGGPKKPISKGLLIGLIAGGAALVIVAIIAVVVLVLPSVFGGGGSSQSTVIDITSEPEQTWDYDFSGGNDEEFVESTPTLVTVGDNQVLVAPSFNYDNYTEGDEGWYEGYDEDYDYGYESGEEYNADYEAWYSDPYSDYDTYPDYDDYFYDDSEGFSDGFYDAYYGDENGANKLEKPVDPDYKPTLSLVDISTGNEAWNIDLTEVFDDITFDSYVNASDVAGSNAVLVSYSTTNDDDEYVSVVATLNKSNGDVISTVSDDRTFLIGDFEGDVILGVANKDGDEVAVGRYSVDGLDEDPKWEADVDFDGYGSPYVHDNYVFVASEKGGVTLDARTGEEAKFGDDLDEADYYFVGGQLVRIESSDDGYEIDGYSLEGKSVWDDSIDAEQFWFGGDGTLFVAEAKDSYSELMRINPSNGSEMWGDAYGEDFSSFTGVVGSSVIVLGEDYDELFVLDLGSGEEKASEKVDENSNIILGENQFYEAKSDELVAYGYDGEGDRWKFDVDEDSEGVRQVGRHLVVIDTDKLTINGLAAK